MLFGGNLVRQPLYEGVEKRIIGGLENTNRVMEDTFWIGVWPGLDKEHLDYMINMIKKSIEGEL